MYREHHTILLMQDITDLTAILGVPSMQLTLRDILFKIQITT